MPTETFQRRAIDQFVCHGMILSPNKEWTSKAKLIKFPSATFDILSRLLQGALPDDLIWLWCCDGPEINILMLLKWGACSPWSSFPYCHMRNSDQMIIGWFQTLFLRNTKNQIFIFSYFLGIKCEISDWNDAPHFTCPTLLILLAVTVKAWTWFSSTFLTFIGGISDFEIQLFN